MVDNVRGADFQARSLLRALRIGERSRVARAFGLEGVFIASEAYAARPGRGASCNSRTTSPARTPT